MLDLRIVENNVERDNSVNVFKAFLIIGMILAHCINLLTPTEGIWAIFCRGVNLITFSGFFFCFGYVYNISYLGKKVPFAKKVKSVLIPLLAFYISALSWALIVDRELDIIVLFKILSILNVPPYSEFLLAFSIMSLLFWLFQKQIARIKKTKYFLMILPAILLISLVPFYSIYPSIYIFGHLIKFDYYIGLLLGSKTNSYFPVIQYSFFFFLGIFFSDKKILFNRNVMIAAIFGTIAFIIYCLVKKHYPSRFPPHLLWITGSWFILYTYFLISKMIKKLQFRFFILIGENTIIYLLLSNIFIFSLRDKLSGSYLAALTTGVSIVVVITYLLSSVRKPIA
jgi:hypothetical protein